MQIFVTVNELALMWVLELMSLDILPQGLDDDGPGLGVDPKHTSQAGVQLELRRLGRGKEKRHVSNGVGQ